MNQPATSVNQAKSASNQRDYPSSMEQAAIRYVTLLHALLPELTRRYGVISLSVFGSYVRNEQRSDSDLDVLVEFDPQHGPTLLKFIQLENYLTDTLGVKVDLVEKGCLKPSIRHRILAEAIVI